MAINTVKVQIKDTWYSLTYNSSSGKYEATVTAPGSTSYNNNSGHYFPVTLQVANTAGTVVTDNDTTPTIGPSLQLKVKETVKPTINITSPGSGAHLANNKQPIVFQVLDESGGSGINISSLALKIDGGLAIGNNSAGMVCTAVTNGYTCTYTPQAALSDGAHTFTVNISDNDGNAAAQATSSFTVDTVPPTLNISNPANNFITNNAACVIQGTTNDSTSSPVTIAIKLNGTDQGPVTVSSGSFSKSVTLAEGSNTIVITATDAAGEVTTVTLTGTLDTSVPQINSVTITPNPANTGASVLISVSVTG